MVLVLFPNLTPVSKLVTQMAQEKVQILVRFGEFTLKGIIYFLHARLFLCLCDLGSEKSEILFVVI